MLTMKCFLVLVILPIIAVLSADDDMGRAEKCAKGLPPMYDEMCKKVKNDGNKVVEVKKKCLQYPPKLQELPEVIKIFEKCNVPADICNKDKMQKCGEDQYTVADKWYQANKKDRKEANLVAIALSEIKVVADTCEKSEACLKAEIAK